MCRFGQKGYSGGSPMQGLLEKGFVQFFYNGS